MFAKKKLKRQDFIFQNGWFQTLIRKPGQLHMQQFQISDCEQCTICLFDTAACVYIDQCKFCTIFIGACQSSIFARNCTNITIVATTQQFRVRDCINCHFSLCCDSQPIIQSSHGITFSCFGDIGYKQLFDQILLAKCNPWNNNWFDIYDFTPRKDRQNYSLKSLPQDEWVRIKSIITTKIKQNGLSLSKAVVPNIKGKINNEQDQIGILVYHPVPQPLVASKPSILQSRVHQVIQQQLKSLKIDGQLQKNNKYKILFLKIFKKDMQFWKNNVKNNIKIIVDSQLLQLYENTVFAPFRDQH